jgi:aminopeptidase N
MNKAIYSFIAIIGFATVVNAQEKPFTHADTLRGSITPQRAWWDVLRYDIWVKPDYGTKSIQGQVTISYKKTAWPKEAKHNMQVDLQQPLIIDSAFQTSSNAKGLKTAIGFERDGNVAYFDADPKATSITIYYHGTPREAIRPPWDGGWIWKKDSLNRPWMSVACQGLGASVWYPCKDHQSDEPDKGASLSMVVADTLAAVGNGRLLSKTPNNDGTTTWKWEVKNPINNYNIIPYIGKYVNWTDTYNGEKGPLDLSYWVLDYNEARARVQFTQSVNMLKAFEHWFGPYPFYEDGYKLVESPHLGMEHQSAVGYGNHFQNGYLGRDLSHSGQGLKWDFIIIHESGHEWFANNITSKDLADMWIHESITNFSETLFTDYWFGKEAGDEYNYGTRKNIRNDKPIIAHYGVNEEGSGDMYYKGGNMMQLIRHSIDNDSLFRQILRGLNKTFYHQTVTTQQVESYISKHAGIDFSKVFDQYLRNTQIPVLEYYVGADNKTFNYRLTNCVKGLVIKLPLHSGNSNYVLNAAEGWKSIAIKQDADVSALPTLIDRNFYIVVKQAAAAK